MAIIPYGGEMNQSTPSRFDREIVQRYQDVVVHNVEEAFDNNDGRILKMKNGKTFRVKKNCSKCFGFGYRGLLEVTLSDGTKFTTLDMCSCLREIENGR